MNSKTKKLIVLLLDVTIGVLVELWASDTFPNFKVLITMLFFIFLAARLIFDWFIDTVEDKFYDLHIKTQLVELETNLEIQTEIKKKMKTALSQGDFEGYKKYLKIKKGL